MKELITQLYFLFERYKNGTATIEERKSLFQLIQRSELEGSIKDLIQSTINETEQGLLPVGQEQSQAKADEVLRQILASETPETQVLPIGNYNRWRVFLPWMAAASVLAVMVSGYFFLVDRTGKPHLQIQATIPKDIMPPGKNKAMITLSNGKKYFLDEVQNGTLIADGERKVEKTAEGKIIYTGTTTALEYNTLFNPRGSQAISLTLSDATQVWLNAESSIKYPVAFIGPERRVEITGEAYFEVAHNAAKPFLVQKDNITAAVLGTRFNVNAYNDEGDARITLLQGKIDVITHEGHQLLMPSQQAQVNAEGSIELNRNRDLDEVMAWKNGSFSFHSANIQTVMRQLARWYNIEVEYKGKLPSQQFNGEIGRDLTLKQVLEGLQFSKMSFHLEGNKLTINPKN